MSPRDSEAVKPRYHIRGNGIWDGMATLSADEAAEAAYAIRNARVTDRSGVEPLQAGQSGAIAFKIEGFVGQSAWQGPAGDGQPEY